MGTFFRDLEFKAEKSMILGSIYYMTVLSTVFKNMISRALVLLQMEL